MNNIALLDAIMEEMNESSLWGLKGIVDEPQGNKQESDTGKFDHIFVDQYQRFEDCFYGSIYLPLENGQYLECWYED